jgi:CDP-4-dehydro-6-deoxyglucose reductase
VLACAHTAASSELTLETLEAVGPADIPSQEIVTTVRALRPLAPDTLLLHLQTPRSHRLRFLAGQSLTLAAAQGEDVHAQHPIASCPCDDRNLQFFIPRDHQDPLACSLFAGAVKPETPSACAARWVSSCWPIHRTRWSLRPATRVLHRSRA